MISCSFKNYNQKYQEFQYEKVLFDKYRQFVITKTDDVFNRKQTQTKLLLLQATHFCIINILFLKNI